MQISPKTSSTNTSYLPNRKIDFIVLHYTAGLTSKPGTAFNTASWFANPSAKASADFIVDDQYIVQYNPDLRNRYCWSVGGEKYKRFTTSLGGQFHGICKNNNSISIEMNSNKKNHNSLSAADDDWYLTDATVNNAAELTKYLMKEFNIDIDHVIMHHQVNGKVCPNPWTLNEGRLVHWYNFKKKLQGDEEEMTQEQFNQMFTVAMQQYRKTLQDNDSGTWSKESRDWATSTGLVKGAATPLPDGTPNYMWADFLTREQMAALLYRFKDMK